LPTELRIVCQLTAPLGVTVNPPLLSVMPAAVASAADQTDEAAAAIARAFDVANPLPALLVAVTLQLTDVPPSALTVR
jgi:hypothetical protein